MSKQLRRFKTVLDFVNGSGDLTTLPGILYDESGEAEIYVERMPEIPPNSEFLLKQTIRKGLELLIEHPEDYIAYIARIVSSQRIPITALTFEGSGALYLAPSVANLEELIWIIIAKALSVQMSDGKPLSCWLKRCTTCSNLFIQKTKRGSHFCQPRCRWIRDNQRKITQEKR